MKLRIVAVSAITLISVGMVGTGNARVNVHVGVGIPIAPAVLTIPPPTFVMVPDLGFYAAVGIQQNIFFSGNMFYMYQGGHWFSSPFFGGPWTFVSFHHMPLVFRRHTFVHIRTVRDRQFVRYRRGGYRGRQFRPNNRPPQNNNNRPGQNNRPPQNNNNRPGQNNRPPQNNPPSGPGQNNRPPQNNNQNRPGQSARPPQNNAPSRPAQGARPSQGNQGRGGGGGGGNRSGR